MATQQLALERGGAKRVELSWGFSWRDFTVKFDGTVIGKIDGGLKALKEGRSFNLPDGSQLNIAMKQQSLGFSLLEVTHNGKVLPGSAADPQIWLRNAYFFLYIVGAILILVSILLGLTSGIADNWMTFVLGIVFLVLGYLTSKRSSLALLSAIGLYAVVVIVGLFTTQPQGQVPAVLRAFGAILPLMIIWQGLGAIKALRAENSVPTPLG